MTFVKDSSNGYENGRGGSPRRSGRVRILPDNNPLPPRRPPVPPTSGWNGVSVSEMFIKSPTRDVLSFAETTIPVEELASLFVEDIGGVELSQVSNYQTVYGTNPSYKVLDDLANLTPENNPIMFLLNRKQSDEIQYGINYNDYYVDYNVASNGDIELNFNLLPEDCVVEIQMDGSAIINIQETT